MSTQDRRSADWSPEMFWQIRERELAHKLQLVRDAVDECELARQVLYVLSETAKIHDPEWETAQSSAMRSLRRARGAKTQLRHMVAKLRDTIRIRPQYAETLTQKTADILDTASRMCEYLDAHGF